MTQQRKVEKKKLHIDNLLKDIITKYPVLGVTCHLVGNKEFVDGINVVSNIGQ